MIYLDNSATTAVDEAVVEAMLPWLTKNYGNASSIYSLGRAARVAVEDARAEIAHLLGAHPAEIFFTSGGTESNNTIIKSVLHESDLADAVCVSPTEHHAVLEPAHSAVGGGKGLYVLPVDADGRVTVSEVPAVNRRRTLVSVMHANNETGVVQPVYDVRQAAPDVYLHSDAVQSFGKITVKVDDLGVDFLSVSAHKIHGPKGIGAMYIRKGIDFKAHQHGGAQERNRRAGTEPVHLIVGFQVAARRAAADLEHRATVMMERTRQLREGIAREIPNIRVNTPETGVLPNIINISFLDAERLDGEGILQALDMAGLAVSNGSACVSGSQQPSHVLLAMGRNKAEALAAVRLSVSYTTTQEEIFSAITILADVIREMRG